MKTPPLSKIFSLLLLVIFLSACTPAASQTRESTQVNPPTEAPTKSANTITLATLDWPPYVGYDIPYQGFTAAIVTEAFKRSGYQVKIDFMPWPRVLQEVESGKYDAGFPEYYSEKGAKKFLMSESFASGPLGFYKRKADSITYTKLEDLKEYRIGIVLGYTNTPEFDAADYLQKETATSDEQNVLKLARGRIDLIIIDKFVAQYIINTRIPEEADNLEFLEPALLEQTLHIIFSRNVQENEQRLKAFNDAIQAMRADGTLAKILAQHGFKTPPLDE